MKYLHLFLAYFLFIKYTNCQLCIGETSPSNQIISCDSTCDTCHISCNTPNKCSDKGIYSTSITTIIDCLGKNACVNAKIYIGNTVGSSSLLPSNNFTNQLQYNSTTINCDGETACKDSIIEIGGNFINGIILDTKNTFKSFENGNIKINIEYNQIFNVICGTIIEQYSCLKSVIEWISGDCQCNGLTKNNLTLCSSIIWMINTNAPTNVPTLITKIPTYNPTLLPTIIPTIMYIPTNITTINPIPINLDKPFITLIKQNIGIFIGIISILIVLIIVCIVFLCLLKKKNKNNKNKDEDEGELSDNQKYNNIPVKIENNIKYTTPGGGDEDLNNNNDDKINVDDATYISQIVELHNRKNTEQNEINLEKINKPDNFKESLALENMDEGILLDNIMNEIDQENDDKQLAKFINNNISPGKQQTPGMSPDGNYKITHINNNNNNTVSSQDIELILQPPNPPDPPGIPLNNNNSNNSENIPDPPNPPNKNIKYKKNLFMTKKKSS